MKALAFAALLLLVGCAPTVQRVESAAQNVQFVARVNAPEGSYTAFVFASEPLVIRRMVFRAPGFVTDEGFCEPWVAMEDGWRCAEGVAIQAAPHGLRLNFTATGAVKGNVCLQKPSREVLLCQNLRVLR